MAFLKKLKCKTEITLGLIALICLCFIVRYQFKYIQIATLIVLFLTMIAIVYYTIVTWRLKDLTSKQISLSIKPLIICDARGDNLILKNVGKAAALYIKFEKIPIKLEEKLYREYNIHSEAKYFSFADTTCLEVDSKWMNTSMRVYSEKNIDLDGLNENAIRLLVSQIKRINIYYQDIEQTKYTTKIENQGGVLVVTKFTQP